jgi:hypothetical protein
MESIQLCIAAGAAVKTGFDEKITKIVWQFIGVGIIVENP